MLKTNLLSNDTSTNLKSTIKVPSLSGIKSIIDHPKQETEKVVQYEEVAREYQKVTFDQLKVSWEKYIQKRKLANKPYEIVILNQEISLSNDIITLNLTNPVQLEQLNDFRVDLLAFLRKDLRNYGLDINPVVSMQTEKKLVYTTGEKFNYLAEKNPVLLKLKQKLGLDFDY